MTLAIQYQNYLISQLHVTMGSTSFTQIVSGQFLTRSIRNCEVVDVDFLHRFRIAVRL